MFKIPALILFAIGIAVSSTIMTVLNLLLLSTGWRHKSFAFAVGATIYVLGISGTIALLILPVAVSKRRRPHGGGRPIPRWNQITQRYSYGALPRIAGLTLGTGLESRYRINPFSLPCPISIAE